MKILDVFNNENVNPIEYPYIIAEAGVNHEGDMDLAMRLIDEAKEGGADAIKFQTYKADTIASKDSPHYWDIKKEPTRTQHELFQKYDKFWKNEYEKLKIYCDKADIEFMSTPFDVASADFLNDLMDVFKISSSDITNRPFIEYMAKFNKPILLSTGASYLHEIQEAVAWIKPFENPLCLLHCVLNYPTPDENADLGIITYLKKKFPEYLIGYSDHTLPKNMEACVTSTLLGAKIIEKHFTHDKTLPGNDHYHAMDKEDLKGFQLKLKDIFRLLGSFKIDSLENQIKSRQNARRSLVSAKAIKQGAEIKSEDLTFKRPAHGISAKYYYDLIGKRAVLDIEEDEVLQWNKFE